MPIEKQINRKSLKDWESSGAIIVLRSSSYGGGRKEMIDLEVEVHDFNGCLFTTIATTSGLQHQ